MYELLVDEETYQKSHKLYVEAMQTYDVGKRQDMLSDVLDINEFYTDAAIELSNFIEDDYEKLGYLNTIYEKATLYLMFGENIGLNDEDFVGAFWGIMETRPFMRAKHAHMDQLMRVGYYLEAIHECLEILTLNESDNMGVRYSLMTLCIITEEYEIASKLRDDFPEDSFMWNFPYAIMLCDQEKKEEAQKVIMSLSEKYPFIKDVFNGDFQPSDEMIEMVLGGVYQPFSESEILFTLNEMDGIITNDFVDWMVKSINK